MNRIGRDHTESNDRTSTADQALQWFVLLQSGHATPTDRQIFHEWIGADVSRRLEFERCSRLWGELDFVKPLLREELAQANFDWKRVAQWPVLGTVGIWKLPRFSTVLAALLAVVIAGGWWLATGFEYEEYRTAKGERRAVLLSEGSAVTMNTETVVATELSPLRRRVVLREGEALFRVSHNDRRSFEVLAGDRVIRDVGTQFVIRRQEQNVTVTVVEGAIEVQRSARVASTPAWQLLTSGEQVSYGQGDVLSSVKTVSLAETTAWLDGTVIFDGRPLAEVIQEIGRYHTGEIRILDPHIATVKVSGVFGVKDRNGFLRALERAVPVVASHVNGDLVVLEEKK